MLEEKLKKEIVVCGTEWDLTGSILGDDWEMTGRMVEIKRRKVLKQRKLKNESGS